MKLNLTSCTILKLPLASLISILAGGDSIKSTAKIGPQLLQKQLKLKKCVE